MRFIPIDVNLWKSHPILIRECYSSPPWEQMLPSILFSDFYRPRLREGLRAFFHSHLIDGYCSKSKELLPARDAARLISNLLTIS